MLDIFGVSPRNYSRSAIVSACVLLLAVLASGATTFVRPPLNIEELQGRWSFVSFTYNNKNVPFKSGNLEIKSDHCILTQITSAQETRFVLDTTCMPASIDYIAADGAKDQRRTLGVFEVSSTRLVICLPRSRDQSRPTSLESTPGSGRHRTEWQRRGLPPLEGSSISQMLEGEWAQVKSIRDGVESEIPIKLDTTWVFKNNVVTGELKSTEEYRLSLRKDSARADLLRTTDNQIYRALIDYEPQSQELRIAKVLLGDDQYPNDFVSPPSSRTSIYVFKKDAPKSP